ncbi:MAG TPA: YiiD C-terminal domain-containing protein [Bacteroidia bacterium]|nr:YiiD C-terminal domain-containing protein [Bacteroidia bacterium]
MDITKVPFNQLLGISLSDHPDYLLQLDDKKEYTNHLETVHAAALFALAEGSGAQLLLKSFPEEIIENVIPVLRKVDVSYKKPAKGVIRSKAILQYKTLEEILAELQSKKRTLITTTVELYDTQNTKVFMANFEWFVVIKEN